MTDNNITKTEAKELKNKVQELIERNKEYNLEVRKTTITTIAGALTLVAGLFWQDAIKQGIGDYLPAGNSFTAKIVIALIITVIFATIIVILNKSLQKTLEKKTDVK
ncbi:Uncharacterised protein [uncultured archaeon]|nr:Uncharacterised protein [uncultured archaeon]